MKKTVVIVIETILIIAAIIGIVFLYLNRTQLIADKNALVQQNSQLQQSVDAIGATTTVFTVKAKVKPGDEIKAEQLTPLSVPISAVADNTVVDLSLICGTTESPLSENQRAFYKITILPGTQLTTDMIMREVLNEPVYDIDVPFNYLPIGIKVGDYIDIRVSYPFGEELIVLPRKRIYYVIENVCKFKVTEGEMAALASMDVEYNFYKRNSVNFRYYAIKYIEPGLSEENPPINMYPVLKGADLMIARNPNIKDKDKWINDNMRTYLDDSMARLLTIENSINGVWGNAGVESDKVGYINKALQSYYKVQEDKIADGTAVEETLPGDADLTGTGGLGSLNGGISGLGASDVVVDINNITNNASESLKDSVKEMETVVQPSEGTTQPAETIANVDDEGNRSDISNQPKEDAKDGGNIFKEGDIIH